MPCGFQHTQAPADAVAVAKMLTTGKPLCPLFVGEHRLNRVHVVRQPRDRQQRPGALRHRRGAHRGGDLPDHPWIQEYFNGPRGRAAQVGFARGAGDGKSVDKPVPGMLAKAGLFPASEGAA